MKTMSELKQYLRHLMQKSIMADKENTDNEFENWLDSQVELSLYSKRWDDLNKELDKIAVETCKKLFWEKRKYQRTFSNNNGYNSVRGYIQSWYVEHSSKEDKITAQFATRFSKLNKMRDVKKAIEFLALCGIVIPVDAEPDQEKIDVDPEFIKSILPKNLMIEGASE